MAHGLNTTALDTSWFPGLFIGTCGSPHWPGTWSSQEPSPTEGLGGFRSDSELALLHHPDRGCQEQSHHDHDKRSRRVRSRARLGESMVSLTESPAAAEERRAAAISRPSLIGVSSTTIRCFDLRVPIHVATGADGFCRSANEARG